MLLHIFTHIDTNHVLLVIETDSLQVLLQAPSYRHRSVLRNRNEPIGFVGSLIPALDRIIASVTFVDAVVLTDNPLVQLVVQSARILLSLALV